MRGRLVNLAHRPQLPRRTVRLRLTLLYGVLFLASGAALLAITYALVSNSTGNRLFVRSIHGPGTELEAPPSPTVPPEARVPEPMREQAELMRAQAESQRDEQLDQLLIQSGIALGLMSVVSIGLGWLVAGRVLRPLRTMTATTRRISEHNLHQRLALDGPSDELKDLGDTIDGLLARLEAAFEAERRFVANASHELRTPLAMMRTSLDVAAAKPGPVAPELSALDGKLREGLDRADRLLESFLTLARAQHGEAEQAAASLPEIIREVVAGRGDAIAADRIELRRELEDAEVIGSETLLAHLVENLIDNAIRHNEPGGWIRVATHAEEDRALLVVESGGPRLSQSTVQELARPFRRLGAERTGSRNGVGLGLSIVAAIAAAHGGQLGLEARAEGGLGVRVDLPRAGAGLVTAGEPA